MRSSIFIITSPYAELPERQAALELQRYLYEMSRRMPEIRHACPLDSSDTVTIVLGGVMRHPALADPALRTLLEGYRENLGQEGFAILPVDTHTGRQILIVGGSPQAVLYGAYELLENLGVAFHLGGDTVHHTEEPAFPQKAIVKRPVFSIRGSLPWYNFFNSPTAWNLSDYQTFFDNMVKLKNNFVGFHVYDNEPFAAYWEQNTYKMGEPLSTTAVSTWGTTPLETRDFGFGTGAFFDAPAFGADAALADAGRDERIRLQQQLLRDALQYAKSRGLKVCLGFEVSGDMTFPDEQTRFEKRLTHLLTTYPMLDYVWLWQPECWCGHTIQEMHYHGTGFPLQPGRSSFSAASRAFEGAFDYLADPKQINEGVRMTLYGRYAHTLLQNISPGTKLVLSGWGGDKWLHFTDLLEGLDKTLPKDIVFSALDNLNPLADVSISDHYGKVAGRDVWVIPWFENDGDQWCPQPYTAQYTHLLTDALQKNCRGVLGIHWRTRGIEEIASYTARFAWDPTLSFDGFYRQYACGLYGAEYGPDMARIHIRLHNLGYRWAGEPGQCECGHFRWVQTKTPQNLPKLTALGNEVKALMERARQEQRHSAFDNLSYLYWNIQWVLQYEQAAAQLNDEGQPGPALQSLLNAELALDEGREEEARLWGADACQRLNTCGLDEAMQSFAKTVSNRGELGVLATINAKAYADYCQKLNRAQRVLARAGVDGNRERGQVGRKKEPVSVALQSTFRNTFVTNSTELQVIIRCSKPEDLLHGRVELLYRPAGESHFSIQSMTRVTSTVYRVNLPPCQMDGLMEYYARLVSDDHTIAVWPTGAPERTMLARYTAIGPEGHYTVTNHASLLLNWSVPSKQTVVKYRIFRSESDHPADSCLLATSPLCFYEDLSCLENTAYTYTVIPVAHGERELQDEMVDILVAPFVYPPLTVPVLEVDTRWENKIYLYWEHTDYGVRAYHIFKAYQPQGPFLPVSDGVVEISGDGYQQPGWVDTVPDGSCVYYRLDVTGADGILYQGTDTVEICPDSRPAEPLLHLQMDGALFDSQGHNARWLTHPDFRLDGTHRAADFHQNMIIVPHHPSFSPAFELTIAIHMRAYEPQGVLLEYGMRGFRGYALQLINGQLVFTLSGVGELQADFSSLGDWSQVAAVYDGHTMTLYIDGEIRAEKPAVGRFSAFSGDMRIGREFRGLIQTASVWPTALTQQKIRALLTDND